MINAFLTAALLLMASYCLTKAILKLALLKNMLDHPNDRSSHQSPTPRLGGLAFVIIINLFFITLAINNTLPLNLALALVLPPSMLALVGLFDDIYQLSSKLRLGLQIISVAIVLALLEPFHLTNTSFITMLCIGFIVCFAMVWIINLFNFMDGIDGIAGMEFVFLLFSLSLLLSLQQEQHAWLWILGLTASPVLGFLLLNWAPAKIFMGDVGSTYLGLLIGIFFLIAIELGITMPSCIILLGVFLCDASWTLTIRMLSGQRWFAPHRNHAYQKWAVHFGSHSKVTLLALAVNIFWLLPIALVANRIPNWGLELILIAHVPLLWICYKSKAGMQNAEQ